MSADLELSVLSQAREGRGYVAGFAVTDEMIVALGGVSSSPIVMASSNARDFVARKTPKERGLRDAIAIADAVWACGEYGQLAVSRDHGASWRLLETGTDDCLFGLALGIDGALWVVGDNGYVARVLGQRIQHVDFETTARLASVHAVRDEIVALGFDGQLRRWRAGKVTSVPCGATKALTDLAVTSKGTWVVVGDGGFIARSPDGQWYSRAGSGVEVDLEAICALPDGSLVAVGGGGTILRSADDGRTWAGVPHELGGGHLWAIARFGEGMLIGGDGGLVARFAPSDDAMWRDRGEVAAAAPHKLEEVLAAGPEGFIENGLEAYLAAIASEEAAGEDQSEDAESEDAESEDGESEDGESEDAESEDEESEEEEEEAFALLGEPGDAESFRESYGMPLPQEAQIFLEKVAGHGPWDSFEELRLDAALLPDVGEHNLFELIVRRDQREDLGTDLVDAFCGVVHIGSLGNGDTYHLELYEWDGPRQVLHFDHETRSLSKVVADSLESLVYLAALVKAGDEGKISREAYAEGLIGLHAKVSPTWHFEIQDKDRDFEHLEPRRRDSEFFFYRSRWITALLKHDSDMEVRDIPALFMADFNQVIAPEQLTARLEACERFIPTALYSMWRAYFFDEPELAQYLELGRGHAARLVRDAARLIDELLAGRNELGTIRDMRAYLAELRGLDLDPRRAEQRRAETAARAKAEATRKDQVAAELMATPAERWQELAWRWLGDGIAHRVLLEQIERLPPHAAQLAALDELRELRDDERAVALPRLAAELSSVLEAVLAGSLVRDDRLEGVLARPREDDGERAPGWDAIDAALHPIYGDAEPMHYGAVVPYALGGKDPIHAISAYERDAPVPHWHFVTYGFTDLFDKETTDPEVSGFGFELTMRIARGQGEGAPPAWALNFLQNLGRYVFGTGNRFALGHKMGLNGPIALGHETAITAVCFAEDPELDEISSELGKARFLQVVGITDDEYRLVQEWSVTSLVDLLRRRLPYLVTDLGRASVLADPAVAAEVERRVAEEGSMEDCSTAGDLAISTRGGRLRIELGALYAASLPRAMRGRILHGRTYELRGRGTTLRLEPSEGAGFHDDEEGVVLELTPGLAGEIDAQLRAGLAGTYQLGPWLQIVVTPSFIRSPEGRAIEVRGVVDPEEARRILAEENARFGGGEGGDEDKAREGHDADEEEEIDGEEDVASEDEDDAEDEEDEERVDTERIAEALRMTGRALRLSPEDIDVQLTHAMLLLDGDRGGLDGADDELLERLPRFVPQVRIGVAVRMGERGHARFGEAVDIALGEALPEQIFASSSKAVGGGAVMMSFGNVASELFGELGEAILAHAPSKMARLVPLLPDDVNLISELAWKAIEAKQRDSALALYDRVLALPIPKGGQERMNYLRAMNNACVQAHAAKAYDAAVRIADRAQPVAHENPYLYHSAACAYVAIGDLDRAFEQVKLAMQHGYDHLPKVEVDADLGPLLEWPEFKALFRDWHARREGN